MLPLLAVALGIWLNPLDPLWVRSAFPWAWFAPIILALRYGPFPGLAAAGVLLLAWLGFSVSGRIAGEFPKINFLGGLIFVMLCGEFSSARLIRARRAEGVQRYLDQRLDYLTHQYYLLRLSHDRLEQDLIGRPMAMRDALLTLRNMIKGSSAACGGPLRQLPGAGDLLRLLAQYCQIETAALYGIQDDVIDAQPIAIVGASAAPLNAADPLIRNALETGRLSHVAHAIASGESPGPYLVAAPLTTFAGRQIGVLAVEHVPFFALHEEMLQTLNLLLGYYTDGLVTVQLAAEICAAFPLCPAEFAAELQRSWRARRDADAGSVIVTLEFQARPEFANMMSQIRRQQRSLDVSWLIDAGDRRILANLMPLAGTLAAEGYIARVEGWIERHDQRTMLEAGIFPRLFPIDAEAPLVLLNRLFDTCHVSAEARHLRDLRIGA